MENGNWVTGNIVLRINGEPVEMEMTVPAFPIKPHRMLPVFQQMSSAMVGECVNAVEAKGKSVSCKAGCGACCRQAVPISEVEAYQLAELVESMPEPRQSEVRQRFAQALAHFTEMKWFDELIDIKDLASAGDPDFNPDKFNKVITNYMKEDIPCPFLEDESCSIHPDRPLVCREYLVTSPSENCAAPTKENIEKVPIFMQPSKAMLRVGKTKNSEGISSLMMIEALDFVERFPESFVEKTGPEWASDFFRELSKKDAPMESTPTPAPIDRRRKKKRWK